MAKIVTPEIKKIYRKLINQTIEDLNKPVVIHLEPIKVDCPNCLYDTLNKKSSGVFDTSFVAPVVIFGDTINPISFDRGRCPVCFGEGVLTSENTRNIKALVKWNPGGTIENIPIGREGAPLVRIKAKRTEYDHILSAEYFVVDGVRCEKVQPPTIRGLGTEEVLVTVLLVAVEPGSSVSS